VGRGAAFSLSYAYCPSGQTVCTTNNGNMVSQAIGHLGAAGLQSYGYDSFGRLSSVSEGAAWSRGYDYDRWSNHWVKSGWTGIAPDSFTPVASSNYNTKNQLITQGSSYDPAGNQEVIGSYTISYDAEGKLKTSTLSGITMTMSYDGEGRRVKKVTGTRATVMVYGIGGELAEEYDTAAPAETGLQYLAVDHLGSTRMVFDSAGGVKRCLDYLPFGEQIGQGVNGRTGACWGSAAEPRQKFTAKERDTETSLDYFGARYFSGTQGRFTIPDWAEQPEPVPYADLKDPQSLNLYVYVRSNPMTNRDLDGHLCFLGFGSTCGANAPTPPPPPPAPLLTATGRIAQGPQLPRAYASRADQQRPTRGVTIGLGVAGNADVGIAGAGAEANGTLVSAFSLSRKPTLGVIASGGAVTYAGRAVAAAPDQGTQAVVIGAYAGVGVTGLVANTATVDQLGGPFQTLSGNVGVGVVSASWSLSFDSTGVLALQFTVGPGYGISGWGVTTNTAVGCLGCK